MPVEIFTVKELKRRTVNRIDGRPAHNGGEHCQIGTATLELEPEHLAQFKLKQALERWVRAYAEQYNREMSPDRPRMIGCRVLGLEVQKLFEP